MRLAVWVDGEMLSLELLPRRLALWPCALYVSAAPFNLITLHLDQACYPLLAVTLWWCAARAGASPRGSAIWGAAAGFVAWIELFVSFSLLPALPLAAYIGWLRLPARGQAGRRRRVATVVPVRRGLPGSPRGWARPPSRARVTDLLFLLRWASGTVTGGGGGGSRGGAAAGIFFRYSVAT